MVYTPAIVMLDTVISLYIVYIKGASLFHPCVVPRPPMVIDELTSVAMVIEAIANPFRDVDIVRGDTIDVKILVFGAPKF
ncbi:MAG: hypothetical protein LM568_06170, partial [Desulfurococcaceae archaeon]|nr:hypothetical protein [Desulfurococcaceae archaeon]